jgi:methylated-DNA-[protein]-cysteine S-methyltransferase
MAQTVGMTTTTLQTTTTTTTTVQSPVGPLTLTACDGVLSGLRMQDQSHPPKRSEEPRRDDAAFEEVTGQLEAYFAGTLTEFDVPLALAGTEFQLRVWTALREIPYGETISYGELARWIRSPGASRAVGLANGRNPVGIIVPCHRVIGADGSLTGYGGGLDRKVWLLEHEGSHAGSEGLGQLAISNHTRVPPS